MHLKLSAVLLLAIVCTVSALVCPANYCDKVDCNNGVVKNVCEENQNGIFVEHGTFCGCCPACLIKLNLGDSCWQLFLRGMPPRARCASGLTCDATSRTCVPSQ